MCFRMELIIQLFIFSYTVSIVNLIEVICSYESEECKPGPTEVFFFLMV